MNRRRLALASIAVFTVLCVVGVSILAVAAGGSALAYEVNGTRVSQDDFDSQLHSISDYIAEQRKKAKQPASENPPEGTISSATTAQVLNVSVLRAILRDAAEKRGIELTEEDRAAGKQAAASQIKQFSQTPASYQKIVVEFLAYANALGVSDSDALNAFIAKRAKSADVYINPRYGTWSPVTGVCAPSGCSTTG